MFCEKCGSEISDGARFCRACGAPVVAPADQRANAEIADKAAAHRDLTAMSADARLPRAAGGRSRLPIILSVAAAAVVAVAAALTIVGCGASNGGASVEASSSADAARLDQEASSELTSDAAEAKSQSSSGSDASSTAKPEKKQKFDQAAAEAKALEDAEAAGKIVFTGYVEIVDTATRQEEVGYPNLNPTDRYNSTNAVLILDAPVSVDGPNPDGARASSQPTVTREVESVLLTPHSYSDDESSVLAPWWEYDGQTITVACTGVGFADDTSAILYHASAKNPQIIAPLTEEKAAALETASAGASGGDYVLADSATRAYTRSELEAMDNHTLFLARNELFARHGAGFRTQELRDWFGSKAWYTETIAAGTYGTDILNDIERENAETMLSIEQERNSPYI